MNFFIAGKVVVITGAAGDIGGATTAAFAREGGRLVLVDLPHTRPALEAQSRQLEASGADRAVVFTGNTRSGAGCPPSESSGATVYVQPTVTALLWWEKI